MSAKAGYVANSKNINDALSTAINVSHKAGSLLSQSAKSNDLTSKNKFAAINGDAVRKTNTT